MDEHPQVLTNEELEALAMGELELEVTEGAVAYNATPGFLGAELPSWYMGPATVRVRHRPWRAPVVGVIVAAFLIIEAFGLCNTYGFLTWA